MQRVWHHSRVEVAAGRGHRPREHSCDFCGAHRREDRLERHLEMNSRVFFSTARIKDRYIFSRFTTLKDNDSWGWAFLKMFKICLKMYIFKLYPTKNIKDSNRHKLIW